MHQKQPPPKVRRWVAAGLDVAGWSFIGLASAARTVAAVAVRKRRERSDFTLSDVNHAAPECNPHHRSF